MPAVQTRSRVASRNPTIQLLPHQTRQALQLPWLHFNHSLANSGLTMSDLPQVQLEDQLYHNRRKASSSLPYLLRPCPPNLRASHRPMVRLHLSMAQLCRSLSIRSRSNLPTYRQTPTTHSTPFLPLRRSICEFSDSGRAVANAILDLAKSMSLKIVNRKFSREYIL